MCVTGGDEGGDGRGMEEEDMTPDVIWQLAALWPLLIKV